MNTERKFCSLGMIWSKEDDEVLINNYYELGPKGVSKVLNRTEVACRSRVYYINRRNNDVLIKSSRTNKKWTEEENNFLKLNYPDKGALWCSKHLSRTREACIARARFLKLKRSYIWNDEDDI